MIQSEKRSQKIKITHFILAIFSQFSLAQILTEELDITIFQTWLYGHVQFVVLTIIQHV